MHYKPYRDTVHFHHYYRKCNGEEPYKQDIWYRQELTYHYDAEQVLRAYHNATYSIGEGNPNLASDILK